MSTQQLEAAAEGGRRQIQKQPASDLVGLSLWSLSENHCETFSVAFAKVRRAVGRAAFALNGRAVGRAAFALNGRAVGRAAFALNFYQAK